MIGLGPWVLNDPNHPPPSEITQRTDRSLSVTKDPLLQRASCPFPLPLMITSDGLGALVDTHDHDRWTGIDGMTFHGGGFRDGGLHFFSHWNGLTMTVTPCAVWCDGMVVLQ